MALYIHVLIYRVAMISVGWIQPWSNTTKTVAVVLVSEVAGIVSTSSVVWNREDEPSKFESSTLAAVSHASSQVEIDCTFEIILIAVFIHSFITAPHV